MEEEMASLECMEQERGKRETEKMLMPSTVTEKGEGKERKESSIFAMLVLN